MTSSLAAMPLDVLTPAASAPKLATSAQTLGGQAGAGMSEAAKRAAIAKTAQQFEATFLSSMMSYMFEGVDTPAPFGGGQGEQAFKSFLTDAYAKQMASRGGIGVAAAVQREMLKLQGLK
jgi:Rod binding domain-containing protein